MEAIKELVPLPKDLDSRSMSSAASESSESITENYDNILAVTIITGIILIILASVLFHMLPLVIPIILFCAGGVTPAIGIGLFLNNEAEEARLLADDD